MTTDFIPLDDDGLRALQDAAPVGARVVFDELRRTEAERLRLQDLLDATIAGRNALRASLYTELMAVKKELDEARSVKKSIDDEVAEDDDRTNINEMRMAAKVAKDSGFRAVQVDVDVVLALLDKVS